MSGRPPGGSLPGRSRAAGRGRGMRQRQRANAVEVGLLVTRLVLGIVFLAHGTQKVFGWWGGGGLSATVVAFGHLGFPPGAAYLASFVELLGGIALVLGLLSRAAALALAIEMAVATVRVHLPHGFFMGQPAPGIEYSLALLAMAVTVFLAGPGAAALADPEPRLISRRWS